MLDITGVTPARPEVLLGMAALKKLVFTDGVLDAAVRKSLADKGVELVVVPSTQAIDSNK